MRRQCCRGATGRTQNVNDTAKKGSKGVRIIPHLKNKKHHNFK